MRGLLHSKRLALPLLALGALALFGAACNTDQVMFTEQLVAPPNVPAATPRGGAHVIVDLEAIEKNVEIAPGVNYPAWTFNGTIPAPMIRARVGDTVEIRLSNPAASKNTHNIDLHAVNGPGGGAKHREEAQEDRHARTENLGKAVLQRDPDREQGETARKPEVYW